MKKYIIMTMVSLAIFSFVSFSIFTNTNSDNTVNSVNNESYIIVRVIECQGGDTANKSMILIDRGNNNIEQIDLKKFHRKYFSSNFKIVAKTLNNIKGLGYKLISSSGGGGNDNAMIMQNYIFAVDN